MRTFQLPSLMNPPQVSLSSTRAAGSLLMKTVPEPVATNGMHGLAFVHSPISNLTRASGLPLTKTLGEPVVILPVILLKIESDPMYSPTHAPTAAPVSIAPITNGAANPPVATVATSAAPTIAPTIAPPIKPASALVWAIGSSNRAAYILSYLLSDAHVSADSVAVRPES